VQHSLIALCFGGFQAGMTVLGWVAGISLIRLISAYDHWIAFILLLVVGGKMMWEGMKGGEDEACADILRIIPLMALSLATSIDALAVGVSFGTPDRRHDTCAHNRDCLLCNFVCRCHARRAS